jgi:hypothetical protein
MSGPMNAWVEIEADLRKAMIAAGKDQREIDATLDALKPIVLAVEKAGTKVDADIAWCLLAVEADRQRRRTMHTRMRKAS